MPTPVDHERWALYRAEIEACLREGFSPPGDRGASGKGSSVEEATRRLRARGLLTASTATMGLLGKWVKTQAARASKGRENYLPNWSEFRRATTFPTPKMPEESEPAPAGEFNDIVRNALKRGPRSIEELSHKTGIGVGGILDALDALVASGVNVRRRGELIEIPSSIQPAWSKGGSGLELVSRKDNTFCFGAFGDLHAGSKYCRWDVREDLTRRAERAGAQALFDTGNWLEGEARFNKFDIDVHGFDPQVRHLADRYPRTKLPTYAVWGDDHEGWYVQREGIDVGAYAAGVMREAGHDWHDLGFMEAHVKLVNANTGKVATLAVVHPGGGSAYALSYSIQKIVESYEGGEKPAVGLYGHYHKLWSGIVRNVWVVQTGTSQDQTPFMTKKRLEAHVGGVIVQLEQCPETGAILSMTPQIVRYFNKGWYEGSGRWSKHGLVTPAGRSTDAIR